MPPGAFVVKWRAAELKERSAAHEHFIDLCRLLGEPTPAEADPTGDWYCFERGARKDTGGDGWADVWKRHHLAWGYKAKHSDLDTAFNQQRQYALALENAPRNAPARTCRRPGPPGRSSDGPKGRWASHVSTTGRMRFATSLASASPRAPSLRSPACAGRPRIAPLTPRVRSPVLSVHCLQESGWYHYRDGRFNRRVRHAVRMYGPIPTAIAARDQRM